MKDSDKDYINLSETLKDFKNSWLNESIKRFLLCSLKNWWILILAFSIGFGIHYWQYSQRKTSCQSTLILQANLLKKAELKELLHQACLLDSTEFMDQIGLTAVDYQRIKQIKKVGILYRYDWLQLTPLAKTKKAEELAWLGMQEVTLLSIELDKNLTDDLMPSFNRLFENSKPIQKIKRDRSQMLQKQIAIARQNRYKLIQEYRQNKDAEQFYKDYFLMRKALLKAHIKYSNPSNLHYYYLTEPQKLTGYSISESLIWGLLATAFAVVFLNIKS